MKENKRNKRISGKREVEISDEIVNIVKNNLFANPEEMDEGINRIMGIDGKKK